MPSASDNIFVNSQGAFAYLHKGAKRYYQDGMNIAKRRRRPSL